MWLFTLLLACQSEKKPIFIAVNNDSMNGSKKITVFEDFDYEVSINGAVTEEGIAKFNSDTLILTIPPGGPFMTASPAISRAIVDDQLCPFVYVPDTSGDDFNLGIKTVDIHNCFDIILAYE